MSYFVIDPSGNQYGPADFAVLQQWAREGRVLPTTSVRDAASGQTMVASSIPGLFPGPGMSSPYAGQAPPSYTAYPRGMGYSNTQSNDTMVAWILSILGIVLSVCACSLLGVLLGIGGVIFAKRAQSINDPRAQGPLIASYISIAIGAIWTVLTIIGFAAIRAM